VAEYFELNTVNSCIINVLNSYDDELGVLSISTDASAIPSVETTACYLIPDEMRAIAQALVQYADKIEGK